MKIIRFTILIGLLLCGCGRQSAAGLLEPLGYVTAADGLITHVSHDSIPLEVAMPIPDMLIETPEPLAEHLVIQTWRGTCSGSGRYQQCESGVEIIDQTDGRVVGQYATTPAIASDVVVVDDVAYVTWHRPDTLGSGGLTALDLTDPANPTALGRFGMSMAWAMSLVIRGHDAYLMTTRDMVILDLADPTNLAEIGVFQDSGMPIKALVNGDHLFMI